MSGSFQEEAWAEIAQHIKSTPPEPLTRVLGVSYTVNPDKADSNLVHIESDMSDFFRQAVQDYEAIPEALPLSKHPVPTPYCEPDPALELQPGVMAPHALFLVMKLLYGARMSGLHVVFAICALACQVTKWSKQADKDLQRLYSFLKTPSKLRGTIDIREVDQLCIYAFPDADLAGSRTTARSVSGGVAGLGSSNSWCPLDWSSKRQTATATSTSEAETISLCKLAKDSVMPLQTLWSQILGREVRARYFEDNSATVTIVQAGFSVALRHLQKHHRIALSFAHEACSEANHASIEHISTHLQRGDILTKPLQRAAFENACKLNGVVFTTAESTSIASSSNPAPPAGSKVSKKQQAENS